MLFNIYTTSVTINLVIIVMFGTLSPALQHKGHKYIGAEIVVVPNPANGFKYPGPLRLMRALQLEIANKQPLVTQREVSHKSVREDNQITLVNLHPTQGERHT